MLRHIENHIEKMRGKPEHIRRQYSLAVSFGITAIIFIFWLSTFGARTASLSDDNLKTNPPLSAIASSMTASVGDAYNYAKDLIFGANKARYSSDNIEVTGGGR